jgi:hypothetical protein
MKYPVICNRCGKCFSISPSRHKSGKYFCSRQCRYSATPEEIFWSRVNKRGPDECWEWEGRKSKGYGVFDKNWKWIRAHVFSYELHFRPVGEGMEVMHSCDNPGCVNPAHLRQGTHLENMQDLKERGHVNYRSGEEHPMAKLNWKMVHQIRDEYIPKYGSIVRLGRKHNVSAAAISSIVHNKNWKEPQP